jgi:hypothetical protein
MNNLNSEKEVPLAINSKWSQVLDSAPRDSKVLFVLHEPRRLWDNSYKFHQKY